MARIKKYLFPIFVLFFVVLTISLFSREKKRNDLLKDSKVVYGTIIGHRTNMGANYIDYEYTVNDEKFTGYQQIKADLWDDQYMGLRDLKIKYAVEDYGVSVVVDERFK